MAKSKNPLRNPLSRTLLREMFADGKWWSIAEMGDALVKRGTDKEIYFRKGDVLLKEQGDNPKQMHRADVMNVGVKHYLRRTIGDSHPSFCEARERTQAGVPIKSGGQPVREYRFKALTDLVRSGSTGPSVEAVLAFMRKVNRPVTIDEVDAALGDKLNEEAVLESYVKTRRTNTKGGTYSAPAKDDPRYPVVVKAARRAYWTRQLHHLGKTHGKRKAAVERQEVVVYRLIDGQ